MLLDYLSICYDYYMSNGMSLFSLNLPYYSELKGILWLEHVYPTLLKGESLYSNHHMDERVYYMTIVKNLIITTERSIKIYLDESERLHHQEVRLNGRIWGSLCTRAKRDYGLSILV